MAPRFIHVSEVDPDPKGDTPVLNRFRVSVRHCPLHFDSAADRIYYAGELSEHSVTGVLYDAPSMLLDPRIDEVAQMPAQPFMGAFLVRTHQSRVARHIGGEDGGETASRGHGQRTTRRNRHDLVFCGENLIISPLRFAYGMLTMLGAVAVLMRIRWFAFVVLLFAASAHAQQSPTESSAVPQSTAPMLGIDEVALAGSARASKLIGSKVYAGDTSIGQIEDILVTLDRATVTGVILSVGGFLGMGDKLVAVPVNQIKVGPEARFITNLTKDQLANAPAFDFAKLK